jgi:acyl carrier protein
VNLTREEIERADASSLPEWGSLASMTLIALIEEKFGVRVTPADLPRLTSFSDVLDYVHRSARNRSA